MTEPGRLLRRDVTAALRQGTVPRKGLDLFAVGTDRFAEVLDEELDRVAGGAGVFKALRGDFGCGKSFTARWFQQRALARGFAVSEVQISENDTPLHRLETVYRRAMEGLRTAQHSKGAFRAVVNTWLLSLEDEAVKKGVSIEDDVAIQRAVAGLLEKRLSEVSATQPQFAAALRGCHAAQVREDLATFEGLLGWLMAQPNVGASVTRSAGLRGQIDHTGAYAFLRGLLELLRQCGHPGLLLVLDEVETIQRVKADVREKGLNGLRQLVDYVAEGKFPGLYLLITGTPAFFDGAHGVRRSLPLSQRLTVDFSGDPRFDNPRDAQIRLLPFTRERLVEVGRKVRDLFPAKDPERLTATVDDALIRALADQVCGKLGGKTGIAPRIFLRKLVADVLDKVDLYPDFDPREHYQLKISVAELSEQERRAIEADGISIDDINLEL